VDAGDVPALKSALESKSFNSSKKTVWILEGFLVYFTEERVQEILRFISENSPENSIIMADIHNIATLRSPFNKKYNDEWAEKGAPLIWGSDFPEDVFRWHGFTTEICARYGDEEANFGRFLSYLGFLLDSFPRANLAMANTVVFLGKRDSRHPSELTEWKDFLKVSEAKEELNELAKWILPERLEKLQSALQHFQYKLFKELQTQIGGDTAAATQPEKEEELPPMIPDDLD